MKIGICSSLENAPAAIAAGFDYVEVSASQLAVSDLNNYAGLSVETTNLFFPQIDLYETDDWREYASSLFVKAETIGIKTMVVGSGGARKSRPDIPPAEAEAKFSSIVSEMQLMTSIPLAPESLNRSEADCYNSLAKLANDAKEKGFGFTADAFHILYEWDADGQKSELKELFESEIPYKPTHVHLAALKGRAAPSLNDPQIKAFFDRLKELSYEGRVSLECNGLSPDNFREAISSVHSYL